MSHCVLEFSETDEEMKAALQAAGVEPISSASVRNLGGGADLLQQIIQITPALIAAIVPLVAAGAALRQSRVVKIDNVEVQGYSAKDIARIMQEAQRADSDPRPTSATQKGPPKTRPKAEPTGDSGKARRTAPKGGSGTGRGSGRRG